MKDSTPEENSRKAYRITIEAVPFEDLRAGDLFALHDEDPRGCEDGTSVCIAQEDPVPCEPVPGCERNFKLLATLPVVKLPLGAQRILMERLKWIVQKGPAKIVVLPAEVPVQPEHQTICASEDYPQDEEDASP